MSLEALKTGFISYLQELNQSNEITEEETSLSNISIFMYSSEFKDYLVDELGADVSIFTKSISEIMSMDYVDGQFVDTEDEEDYESGENTDASESDLSSESSGSTADGTENTDTAEISAGTADGTENADTAAIYDNLMVDLINEALQDEAVINAYDTDGSGDLSSEEANIFLSSLTDEGSDEISYDALTSAAQIIQAESETDSVEELLEKVYENATVIKALDTDGDGILSDEEKAAFEEFIKGYDGDDTSLSEDDIYAAVAEIIDGTFSYETEAEEEITEEDTTVETEEEETESTASTASSTGTSSTGSTSGSSGTSSASSSSGTSTETTLEDMTLDELEALKEEKETAVQEARDAVDAVYSGENEAVAQAEEDCADAKDAYDDAVANDDNIPDDLKEERETNLSNIEAVEENIDNYEIQINDKDAQITEQEAVVENYNVRIEQLETSISTLNSQLSALDSDDEDYETKQSEINEKISAAQAELDEAEAQLTTEETTLAELKAEKEELETLKAEEESLLADYEAAKADIEEAILAVCNEDTKAALEEYNEAKANVESVKAEQLEIAQEALAAAQEELDEVNAAINAKQAEEIEDEYSVSDYDFDFDLNLTSSQEASLEAFLENWEENKDIYEEVAEQTGCPAELIAAIHWRESSGDFSTTIRDGKSLSTGSIDEWISDAVSVISEQLSSASIDENDIETWYDFAERYNGLGYRKMGVSSPYVWAGTSNYTSGKYISDGVYSANTVDKQIGVAVMLQALLS